jgi:hypothetical protein
MEEIKKPREQVVVDKEKLETLRYTLLDIQSKLDMIEKKCEELNK